MSKGDGIRLAFGAFVPPLNEQLAPYGYFASKKTEEFFASSNAHIANLSVHGYITDAEKQRIINRVGKDIMKDIFPISSKEGESSNG